MGQAILVEEQIEEGAEFLSEFNTYRAVSVACWVSPSDSDNSILYVASDDIDDTNFDIAYGEVLRILKGKNNQWLDPFQVKVLNSNDPIALAAIKIRDRYPSKRIATRYNGSSLAGMSIDSAYIYQPISAMKSAS